MEATAEGRDTSFMEFPTIRTIDALVEDTESLGVFATDALDDALEDLIAKFGEYMKTIEPMWDRQVKEQKNATKAELEEVRPLLAEVAAARQRVVRIAREELTSLPSQPAGRMRP
jgi:hypothetical protein